MNELDSNLRLRCLEAGAKRSATALAFALLAVGSAGANTVEVVHASPNRVVDASEPERVISWMAMRNQGVVRQELDLSCGAASIAMVLDRLYGHVVSEKEALDALGTGALAATMTEMVTGIRKLGYEARAIALDFEDLARLTTPIILFIQPTLSKIDMGHFVVLERVTPDGVVYRDPTFGNRVLDVSTFKRYWFTRDDPQKPGRAIAILPATDQQRAQAARFKPLSVEAWRPIPLKF